MNWQVLQLDGLGDSSSDDDNQDDDDDDDDDDNEANDDAAAEEEVRFWFLSFYLVDVFFTFSTLDNSLIILSSLLLIG